MTIKIIILNILFLFILQLSAFSYQFKIQGQVTQIQNNQPIENHLIDFYHLTGFYYGSIITNHNGFYNFTIFLPDTNTQTIIINTAGLCDNEWVTYTFPVVTFDGTLQYNFQICDQMPPPPPCHADFNYFPENQSHRIHFINQSDGSFTSSLWNFGDGTTSTLSNPIHNYQTSGMFTVNLTILGDSCSDMTQRQVWVRDSINTPHHCQANFNFHPQMSNPLTIQFIDRSIGRDLLHNWDFGDSTHSTLENPAHTYNQAGTYLVTLNVSGDSCQSSYTQTVVINVPTCNAEFTFEQTPNSELNYHFFAPTQPNIVSWLWDFGDGTTSNLKNPYHSYNIPQTCNVCLTISTSYNCRDIKCQQIIIGNRYNIAGNVRVGENLLPAGAAILINKINSEYLPIEYCVVQDGHYQFDSVPYGNYLIYAIPDFNFNFNYFPKYLPTYFGNQIHYSNSNILNLIQNEEQIDIQLLSYDEIFYGTGQIAGTVQISGNRSFPSNVFDFQNQCVMLLYNAEQQPINFALLDNFRLYQFENLPLGTYEIYPEKAGYTSASALVTLAEGNRNISNLNFNIANGQIVAGIEKNVPFRLLTSNYENKILLQFNNPETISSISIFDVAGNQVYNQLFNKNQKIEKFFLETSKFFSGIYLLRMVFDSQTIYNQSFMKK